jgi:hypothetical protein
MTDESTPPLDVGSASEEDREEQAQVRVQAIKTGAIRIRPSHPAGNMNHPVWRRRLAIFLDRIWTEPLPIYTYLIEHPEGRILLCRCVIRAKTSTDSGRE